MAVDAATTGSSKGASTVSRVVATELEMRGSRASQAARAIDAPSSPPSSSSRPGSSKTDMFVHRTTSAMVRPPRSAARRSGASCLAAAAYQNAASAMPARAGAASTSQLAMRCADDQSAQPARGDQLGRGRDARCAGRVEHPARALPRVASRGCGCQVILDRRGDDRTRPLEQGRDGEPARLAGLGRPDARGRSAVPRWPATSGCRLAPRRSRAAGDGPTRRRAHARPPDPVPMPSGRHRLTGTAGKAAGLGDRGLHAVATRPVGPAPGAGLGVAPAAKTTAIGPAGPGASSAIPRPQRPRGATARTRTTAPGPAPDDEPTPATPGPGHDHGRAGEPGCGGWPTQECAANGRRPASRPALRTPIPRSRAPGPSR